ncbi:MAG TPA: hypothetical protein VN812_02560 [Candidatus Acidoferrales bacterium]|nr:hypothetical protein [Candidatus Acidoferrales bacterium]
MKRLVSVLVVGGLALVIEGTVAYGQDDHLLCYNMQDALTIHAVADLIAGLQPEFTQKGCTLVKPIEFCVPASKENVQGAPAGATTFTGEPLRDDYVCYQAQCPKQTSPPAKNVTDQFGARLEQKYVPKMVCVPASKAPVECGAFGKACAGACPGGERCVKSTTGTCTCKEITTCSGAPDKSGMCGGTCPAGQECELTSTNGKVVCACETPPPPCGLNAAANACSGECTDPTQKCMLLAGTNNCTCQSPPTPCEQSAPQCGGTCPSPDDTCTVNPTSPTASCECTPKSCGLTAAGTCGGTCPAGDKCSIIPNAVPEECGCLPSSCGIDTAGNCGGTCPTGETCGIDSANNCTCTSSSSNCELNPLTGQCSGTCSGSQKCSSVVGTVGACTCQ